MKFSSYELSLYNRDGTAASAAKINELLDATDQLIDRHFVEYTGAPIKEGNPYAGSFASEYSSAFDDIDDILTEFSKKNPDLVIELTFNCDEDEHNSIYRYLNGITDRSDRIYTYEPFGIIKMPSDNCQAAEPEIPGDLNQPIYSVGFAVDGRFYARVHAADAQAAVKEATYAFQDADFGELECIDAQAVNVEDEDGNLTDLI